MISCRCCGHSFENLMGRHRCPKCRYPFRSPVDEISGTTSDGGKVDDGLAASIITGTYEPSNKLGKT